MNVAVSPGNSPYDSFSAGMQLLPPGCHVREHGHRQNHELIFIAEGEGHCEIEGRPRTPGEPMPEAFPRPDNVAEIQAWMRFVPPRGDGEPRG